MQNMFKVNNRSTRRHADEFIDHFEYILRAVFFSTEFKHVKEFKNFAAKYENSNRYWVVLPLSSATLQKYQKLTFLDALKIHFQRFLVLSSLHLMSNGLNGVDISFLT